MKITLLINAENWTINYCHRKTQPQANPFHDYHCRAGLGAGPRLSRGTEAPAGIPLARRFPGQRSPTPPPIPVAVWRTEDSKGRPVANKLIAAIRYAATPSKLAVANFYVYTSKFTADNSSTLVATKFHHVF